MRAGLAFKSPSDFKECGKHTAAFAEGQEVMQPG
jgi:hypothetical protein